MANLKSAASNTVGQINAVIKYLDQSQPDRNFVTDQHDVSMVQQVSEVFASGGQKDANFRQKRSLSLRFRNIVADGVSRTYNVPQDVVGNFTDLSPSGGFVGHLFDNGVVIATLTASGHLTATVKCTARNSPLKSVDIDGAVDMTGFNQMATADTFTATFVGGPFDGTSFRGATFDRFDDGFGSWYTVAHYFGPWPSLPFHVSAVVHAGAGAPPYNLANPSEAIVYLYDETTLEEASSIAGVLKYSSLPSSGRSTGDFDATVRFNTEPSYFIRLGRFDVTA